MLEEQLKIGLIGASGRGRLAEHWHQPQGRSIAVAGMDKNDDGEIDSDEAILRREKVKLRRFSTLSITLPPKENIAVSSFIKPGRPGRPNRRDTGQGDTG